MPTPAIPCLGCWERATGGTRSGGDLRWGERAALRRRNRGGRHDTTPLIIGGNGNNAIFDERFPGRIDEIMLYDRALTPDEVKALASGTVF